MKQKPDAAWLSRKANELRVSILNMAVHAKGGHIGGAYSIIDVMTALYFRVLNHDPKNPNWEGRDRLIVSKGHCSPVTYVTLANAGFFPKEELKTFRKLGSRLQGHVHVKAPGVEFNTGSLGHGLSVANGIALGAKLLKKDFNLFPL